MASSASVKMKRMPLELQVAVEKILAGQLLSCHSPSNTVYGVMFVMFVMCVRVSARLVCISLFFFCEVLNNAGSNKIPSCAE